MLSAVDAVVCGVFAGNRRWFGRVVGEAAEADGEGGGYGGGVVVVEVGWGV